ncbi:MAG: hypothetical protein GSR87_01630 [Desulfurococcales archaeon]|nr:hypothetical protein [Desulfurococcales archaeon]
MKGYAGHTGRLDVIIRSLIASSTLDEACFIGLLGGLDRFDPQYIYSGDPSLYRNASERELFQLVYRCFLRKSACGNLEIGSISIEYLANIVRKKGFNTIYLTEDGVDYCESLGLLEGGGNLFLLGGHRDIPLEVLEIWGSDTHKMSIGPIPLHTSHVIYFISTIMNRLKKGFKPCPGL